MIEFGIKDALDILLVASLLFYVYRLMKESRSLNIFVGIMLFVLIWLFVSQVLEMRLMGSILDKLVSDEILITSDTMVLCGSEILGKPQDRADAVRMLRLLSGREHQVISAVTIRDRSGKKTFSVSTDVYFKDLSDSEIDYYIDNYKPFDKAGAYGIQEWIGYIGITRLDGSFYNVMGFPTQRFYDELQDFLL